MPDNRYATFDVVFPVVITPDTKQTAVRVAVCVDMEKIALQLARNAHSRKGKKATRLKGAVQAKIVKELPT